MRRSEKMIWGAVLSALLIANAVVGIQIINFLLKQFPEAGRAIVQAQHVISQMFGKP